MPDWDEVYTEKEITLATPADILLMNEYLLSGQGRALDYACGLAGNGLFLENKGYHVTAWDLSSVAVNKINQLAKKNTLNLTARQYDLEQSIPEVTDLFDVIVISFFLHRESLGSLSQLLKKDGLLFYQTFSGKPYQAQGPSREAFRLKKNELLQVFSGMTLLYYREDDEHACGSEARPGQIFFVAKNDR